MLTLFELCLDFAAQNIQYVETLKGFPELIGQMLAEKVASLRVGPFTDTDVRIVELFTKAYGTQVLQSLRLSRSKLLSQGRCDLVDKVVAAEKLILLSIIQSSALSQLSLSFNSACRSIDWMSAIGQCSLTHLTLRGVGLTDADITYLTACASVRHSGLSDVEQLDLAENYLTSGCLRKLQCLYRLSFCDLSSNFIQVCQVDKDIWSVSHTALSNIQILNKGWLAENIAFRAQRQSSSRASTAKFYKSNKNTTESHILLLSRCSTSMPRHLVPKGTIDRSSTVCPSVSKYLREADVKNTNHELPGLTSVSETTSTASDRELMNIYS